MTVKMSVEQFDVLIATLQRDGGGVVAGAGGAAAVVGPMGPCVLGKGNQKKPKK